MLNTHLLTLGGTVTMPLMPPTPQQTDCFPIAMTHYPAFVLVPFHNTIPGGTKSAPVAACCTSMAAQPKCLAPVVCGV